MFIIMRSLYSSCCLLQHFFHKYNIWKLWVQNEVKVRYKFCSTSDSECRQYMINNKLLNHLHSTNLPHVNLYRQCFLSESLTSTFRKHQASFSMMKNSSLMWHSEAMLRIFWIISQPQFDSCCLLPYWQRGPVPITACRGCLVIAGGLPDTWSSSRALNRGAHGLVGYTKRTWCSWLLPVRCCQFPVWSKQRKWRAACWEETFTLEQNVQSKR